MPFRVLLGVLFLFSVNLYADKTPREIDCAPMFEAADLIGRIAEIEAYLREYPFTQKRLNAYLEKQTTSESGVAAFEMERMIHEFIPRLQDFLHSLEIKNAGIDSLFESMEKHTRAVNYSSVAAVRVVLEVLASCLPVASDLHTLGHAIDFSDQFLRGELSKMQYYEVWVRPRIGGINERVGRENTGENLLFANWVRSSSSHLNWPLERIIQRPPGY